MKSDPSPTPLVRAARRSATVLLTAVCALLLAAGSAAAISLKSRGAAHGSGCTHSSLLAAHLALGLDPLAAARAARSMAGEAVRDGLRDVGAGAGPVDVLGLARIRAAREQSPPA